ncbi:MAG: thiamine pyrophosphate-dependent enzyme, partial [Pseudomonadota bacterium]
HIDVPISVADAPATGAGVLRVATSPVVPTGADMQRARDALASAKRPLIVAGLDALDHSAAVEAAVERLGAPLITTYKAKGLVDENHPLALGGAGLSPKADAILLPLLREADVILAIGYDPIEMRIGWKDPWDPKAQTVIDITAEPNTHYMHQSTLSFVGDVGTSTLALLPDEANKDIWQNGQAAAAHQALSDAFSAGEGWGPDQVIATAQEILPPETLATADSGAHRILLSQMWRCGFPRALTQSSGLCTMGCAVPLAMGAQIVEPERTTVSFSGDAGFLMVAGELATAAELGLRTIFIVFVDASLALIELKQRQRQMSNRGVDFNRADFAAMGRAFGGAGASVSSKAELEDALKAALEADTFTVIAAEIDRKSYDGKL